MSPEYRCELFIQPKEGINDPQGNTIKWALGELGFGEITRFRAGREFTFVLSAKNIREARKEIDRIARAPLQQCANPVTESYRTTIKYVKKPKKTE